MGEEKVLYSKTVWHGHRIELPYTEVLVEVVVCGSNTFVWIAVAANVTRNILIGVFSTHNSAIEFGVDIGRLLQDRLAMFDRKDFLVKGRRRQYKLRTYEIVKQILDELGCKYIEACY